MCVGLSGCSPLGEGTSSTSSSALQPAQVTHENPSPPPAPQRASSASPSGAQAARAFAQAYINWEASTVVARLRGLAQASVGQARSAMQLAAAQAAGDYELQRGGVANHGTVESVAPLPARPDRYVVVTQERTTAALSSAYQGLRPAWHVALATVARAAGGQWVVSGWQPES